MDRLTGPRVGRHGEGRVERAGAADRDRSGVGAGLSYCHQVQVYALPSRSDAVAFRCTVCPGFTLVSS